MRTLCLATRLRLVGAMLSLFVCLGLILLGGRVYSQAVGEELFQFILAEQVKAKAALDEFAYTVTLSGGANVAAQKTSDRFWHQLTVVRKNGVERAALEYHCTIEEPDNTLEWHRAARSLAGPDYTIAWHDVTKPSAHIYFTEDWAGQPNDFTSKARTARDYVVIADAVELAYGSSRESIEELYYGAQRRLAPEQRSRWTAERGTDEDGRECFIVKRFLRSSSKADLVFTVDPARDFVVTKSTSKAPNDTEVRTVRKDYQEIDGRWFLKRQVTGSADGDVTVEGQEQNYTNVRLGGISDAEVSFESLELPEGALIVRHKPLETNGTICKLEGTSIVPVSDPVERRELVDQTTK